MSQNYQYQTPQAQAMQNQPIRNPFSAATATGQDSQYNAAQPQQYNTTQPQQYATAQPQQYASAQPQQYATAQPQQYASAQPQQYNTTQPQQYATAQQQQYATAQQQQYATAQPQQYASAQPQQYATSQAQSQTQRGGFVNPMMQSGRNAASPQAVRSNSVYKTTNRAQESTLESVVVLANLHNAQAPYARASTTRVPNSATVRQKSHIPLGMVFQPLARPNPGQEQVQTVNFGNTVVVRCKRCRTYINPFVKWENGGRRWNCNLCGFLNDSPQFYVYPIDAQGRREDQNERPELCNGSVDFIAPGEYMVRPPQPPAYMFLIDVSCAAIKSGLVDSACQSILKLVEENLFPGNSRSVLGIITYDSSLHFYDLSSAKSKPVLVIVSDVENSFVPIADGAFVNLHDSLSQVKTLLHSIPDMWRDTKNTESCLGSAIKAAYMCMKQVGGKIIACIAGAPTIGEMAIHGLRDKTSAKTKDKKPIDKEIAMLKPCSDSYKEFASVLVQAQICVELFACYSGSFLDLASLAPIAKHTGGDVHCMPNFNMYQHGTKFQQELMRTVSRETAWEAVMRFRVSRGWKITGWTGHYFFRGNDLLVLPNCHEDQCFSICFELEDAAVPEPQLYVQSALLYSSSNAERRIRVHTYCIPVSNNCQDVIQHMDTAVVAKLLFNNALDIAMQSSFAEARTYIQNTCSQILNGSGSSNRDAVDALPMYVLGMLKCAVFRTQREVSADVKVFHMMRMETVNVDIAAVFFYPRMFGLHDMAENQAHTSPGSNLLLPDSLNLTCEAMNQQGAYLLEDGETIYIWIGKAIVYSWLQAVFGVSTIEQVSIENVDSSIGMTGDLVGLKVAEVVRELQRIRKPDFMRVIVVRQGDKHEGAFFASLVEDKTQCMAISYAEFMTKVAPRKLTHGIR